MISSKFLDEETDERTPKFIILEQTESGDVDNSNNKAVTINNYNLKFIEFLVLEC